MKKIFNRLNTPLTYVFIANIFLNFFLILFSNFGILPLKYMSDFVFYTIVSLALVMYRPKWGMLLFVGTIALENINIAPAQLGIMLRPYQFIGGLTALAVLLKIVLRSGEYKFPKFKSIDMAVLVFSAAGFLSAAAADLTETALKQSVIVVSFAVLYFLLRIFIRKISDIRNALLFFVGSSSVTIFYGFWQNIRFARNLNAFEVMPGRPNATFTEADWLGIYLSLLLAVVYVVIFYVNRKQDDFFSDAQIFNFKFLILNKFQIIETGIYALLVVIYALLLMTVSRSAWLGALATTGIFIFIILTQLKIRTKSWQWREAFNLSVRLTAAFGISLAAVYFFHLTTFQLFNRAQSTGTGLQEITIACPGGRDVAIPQTVVDDSEYARYDCRHINLEDIESEKAKNNAIYKTYRPDPNIGVRQEIYQKSWQEIKKHPVLGIGWGNISPILGQDGRGAGLNSSNIFLEIWLGAGLLGLVAFLAILGYMFIQSVGNFVHQQEQRNYLGLFALLGLFAIIIPNLFNAGIMLGILWLFIGVVASIPKIKIKIL